MLKRALYLCLVTSATLVLLACGGKKDEDALMEDEGAAKPAASASTAAAPAAAAAAPAAGGATVTGKVNFEGAAPAMAPIKMDADAFCKSEHKEPVYEQEVVVNPNKTLEWVLVYVKEGVTGTYPTPTEAITLDQHGCQYRPHVFGMMAGQPLKVLNSDGTLHNIHALPKKNAEFNIGQPFKGMETIKKFDSAETPIRFKCDVHKWMGAYTRRLHAPLLRGDERPGRVRDQESAAGQLRDRGVAREVRHPDPERDGHRDRRENGGLQLQGIVRYSKPL